MWGWKDELTDGLKPVTFLIEIFFFLFFFLPSFGGPFICPLSLTQVTPVLPQCWLWRQLQAEDILSSEYNAFSFDLLGTSWTLFVWFVNIRKRLWFNRNLSDLMWFHTCQKDQVHSNPLSHLNNFWHIPTSSFTGKLAVYHLRSSAPPSLTLRMLPAWFYIFPGFKTVCEYSQTWPKLKKPPSSDGFSNRPKRPKNGL